MTDTTELNTMTPAQAERMTMARARAFRLAMEMVGAGWANDPGRPSVDPAEVARLRKEIAVPMLNGMLLGVADAMLMTAPPHMTPGEALFALDGHLKATTPFLVAMAGAGYSVGHFWTHCAGVAEQRIDSMERSLNAVTNDDA